MARSYLARSYLIIEFYDLGGWGGVCYTNSHTDGASAYVFTSELLEKKYSHFWKFVYCILKDILKDVDDLPIHRAII